MKFPCSLENRMTVSIPLHPAYPLGYHNQLMYLSTQSVIADVLSQVSGNWVVMAMPNKNSDLNAGGQSHLQESWESGVAMMVDTLSVAAGNTAKDKRAKEASNRTQARYPILRKSRSIPDGPWALPKLGGNLLGGSALSGNQHYLVHKSKPNTPLPPQLTVAQLLALSEDNGCSLAEPCLQLILKPENSVIGNVY